MSSLGKPGQYDNLVAQRGARAHIPTGQARIPVNNENEIPPVWIRMQRTSFYGDCLNLLRCRKTNFHK